MSEETWPDRRPALSATLALPLILAALYLPQSWYFFMDYPWNDYRLHWLWLFPGLPTFVPMAMIQHGNVVILILSTAVTTLALGVGLFLLSRRSTVLFSIAASLAFALSVFSALFAHGAFRA